MFDRWCGLFAREVASRGGVVGPAWQWARGQGARLRGAPPCSCGRPVAFTFCLVGTGNFLRALSLHPRQQVGREWLRCVLDSKLTLLAKFKRGDLKFSNLFSR